MTDNNEQKSIKDQDRDREQEHHGNATDEQEQKREELKELTDTLNDYAYRYYQLDDPVVSDREYDELFDRLVKLEEELGIRLDHSPTVRVGGEPLEKFMPHTHRKPLLSLDKSKDFETLRDWETRMKRILGEQGKDLTYMVEYKFDGLTLSLTYEEGQLVQAATRGNGEVGEGILAQVKTIKSIPLTIPYQGVLEVQGEGLMALSTLEEYNRQADTPLKNARNGAAGALRNLDPKVTAKRNLDAFFYHVNDAPDLSFESHQEMIAFLKEQRLPVDQHIYKCDTMEEVIGKIREMEEKLGELDYLTDGIVIKVDSIPLREELGFTQRFPRWAMAFKFEAQEMTTTLRNVVWQVGRTGKLTPAAELDPVDIKGVTVKRATLNNYGDIQRKNVKLGCPVWLRRSNDVIPEIMGGILEGCDGGEDIEKPRHCPSCGTEAVEKGAHLFCPNSLSCKPQLVARMVHFSSRDAMDIEGLSEKITEQLYDELELRGIGDLYRLQYEDLVTLERFGEKKAKNLLEAIENSKNRELHRFIYALGIPNVGRKTAKDLAGHFQTLKKIQEASLEELVSLEDIGGIVGESIVNFFHDQRIAKSIEDLLDAGVEPKEESRETPSRSSRFTEKTIVITGSFQHFSNRKDIQSYLESVGGKVTGSVSKNTDILIVGENAGSKLAKAEKLKSEGEDIEILTEQDFIAIKGDS